jgi:hypothetical protein
MQQVKQAMSAEQRACSCAKEILPQDVQLSNSAIVKHKWNLTSQLQELNITNSTLTPMSINSLLRTTADASFDLSDMAHIFEFAASRLLAIRMTLELSKNETSPRLRGIITKYLMWEGEVS